MGRSRCWYRVGGKRQWWWLSAAVTQSKVKRRALSTHREGSSAGARALTSLPSRDKPSSELSRNCLLTDSLDPQHPAFQLLN